MSQTETYSAQPDVVACELDSGAALLDLRTSLYFSLNGVGAVLWEALQSRTSLDNLAVLVAEKFDVAVEDCRRDVEVYVKELQARQLVTAHVG